ncbi:SDR family oxidoreductase [Evansella sp. AB-P1]|uniref:SDR family oxidoreductase n=1 Tax=Evansella sp. AB-P1 TaxID=3037653 RepID=UPI00241F89FF|nr:SDR family oxidoreductase [Evansella sp. AB-P1]MDG5789528.1 SDR family oxidoreductase [Evansella sp. AB-P1]
MNKKIVFITGTSSGFGSLTTLQLAKEGYYVIATMRNISKKSSLLKKANELNVENNIEVMQLDVTNQDQINKSVEKVIDRFGKIDILINNAGYCLGGISECIPVSDWRDQFETNFFSIVALTNTILPIMRERRDGKIINIGSISGRLGLPGLGPYASSKFALEGYCESLRFEVMPFQISVSLVEAGSYKTNIWEKGLQNINRVNSIKEYNDYINSLYNNAKKTAQQAADPMEVIQTIIKICRSEKPKFRYPVGKGVKATLLLKSILPFSFIEWIIKKRIK